MACDIEYKHLGSTSGSTTTPHDNAATFTLKPNCRAKVLLLGRLVVTMHEHVNDLQSKQSFVLQRMRLLIPFVFGCVL